MELGLLLLFFALVAEGAVVFLNPRGPEIETIYIPPNGYPAKTVQCVTNASANITWVYEDGTPLHPTVYGITTLSEYASAMSVSLQWVSNVPGKVLVQKIHCQAGSTNSTEFKFEKGELNPPDSQASSVRVTEGQDALFTCSFYIIPLPMPPSSAVRWRFVSQATNHSEDLEETGLMLGGTNEPVTAELNIPSVKRSQAGTYRCVVMNELGAVMSSVNPLTVLYGINLAVIPDTVCFLVETKVTLNITVFAIPPPREIQCSQSDGAPFSLNCSSGGSPTNSTHPRLYNFTADRPWTGNVTVYARTTFANDTSTREITVLDPPDVNVSITPRRTGPCSVGLAIQWSVSKNGNSKVSYRLRWKKHGDGSMWTNETLTRASLTPQGGHYVLHGLESGASYDVQVEATNECASRLSPMVTTRTLLVNRTAPDQPVVNPCPLLVTGSSLTISWTVGHNGCNNISNYTVMWSTSDTFTKENTSSIVLPIAVYPDLTQHDGIRTIEHLTAGAMYYVMVKAENGIPSANSTQESFCVPRVLPVLMKDSALSDCHCDDGEDVAKVNVSVTTPDLGCGAMAHYNVTVITDAHTEENVTINKFESHEHESATDIVITIENVTEVHDLTVEVLLVPLRNDSCPWTSLLSRTVEVRKCDACLLQEVTAYLAIIIPCVAVAVAAMTIIIIVMWIRARCCRVQNLKVTRKSECSLAVSWEKPNCCGHTIKGYDVRYCITGSQSNSSIPKTPDEGSAIFEHLPPNTQYYTISVRAVKSFWNGSWTSISTSDKGHAVQNLKVTQKSECSLAVTWEKPKHDGRDTSKGYDVRYCITGPQTDSSVPNALDEGSAVFEHLTPNIQCYTISVRAVKSLWNGPWTSISVVSDTGSKTGEEGKKNNETGTDSNTGNNSKDNKTNTDEENTKTRTEPCEEKKHPANSGTKKQEPTYMQPDFLKEEERPPQRFPTRPIVYSKLDPKATQELQKWKQEVECELATKQDAKQETNVPGMSLSDDDFEELPDVNLPDVNTSLV